MKHCPCGTIFTYSTMKSTQMTALIHGNCETTTNESITEKWEQILPTLSLLLLLF